jgi:copper oxidase (laccase) domain-containing protein
LILAVDPERRAFGTAHASWRGTVTSIAAELIRQMIREFRSEPSHLMVGICPCAGAEEYEVGPEIPRIAESRLGDVAAFFPRRNGRLYFDMRAANVAQLVASGVPADRISISSASTMSDRRFYSHRRDGAETGRFALIAGFRA